MSDVVWFLQPVNPEFDGAYLFKLLQERDIKTTSISHQKMPTFEEHMRFVARNATGFGGVRTENPDYKSWFLIWHQRSWRSCGSVYLTRRDEIGVQVELAWQCLGIGKWAVLEIMKKHPEVTRFFANINPYNLKSIHLFRSLGFFDCAIQLQWRQEEHGPVIQGAATGLQQTAVSDAGTVETRARQPDPGGGEAPCE